MALGRTLMLLGAVARRNRRTSPLLALGLVWFLAPLIPSSVLVVLDRGEPIARGPWPR